MSVRSGIKQAEARAVITAIFMVLYFVTVWILILYGQSFFQQVFPIITVFFANALGVFYGAKNGEKRFEQLIQQLPLFVASQTAREIAPIIGEIIKSSKTASKPL